MPGQVKMMILRLRTSALALAIGALGIAACASSETTSFDETEPEDSGAPDVKTTDAKPDVDKDDSGGTGGAGGEGGAGGAGGAPDDDTCGLANCPEPEYDDFFKCCTSPENECGYKNGPSGFCYGIESPNPGGAGGGP